MTDINSFSPQTENEHQSLVIEYNRSEALYPADRTVVGLFESRVELTPDDEAIRLGDRTLTYHDLNARANQMAAKLRSLGVGKGHFVALYMGHSIEVVCAMLGALKAGAAYVPVDIATPKERLAFILQDIAQGTTGTLPVLVTQTSLLSGLPDGAAQVITLDADLASIGGYPTHNPDAPASPGDLAYVIYTSGSTGTPKGVMIEHRSLVNYIWWANEKYCRGERLTWPLFSSLAFDLTVTSIFTPLISGGRIVVYREDPGVHGTLIFKVIEDNAADIVKLTPAHLAMVKDMIASATRIRKFIVGGEDFKTELARDITRNAGRSVEIYNEYGPTEATVGCMIHRYDREKDLALSVPIGTPAANTCIFILDEQLRPVPVGVIGEMYLGGGGLARGYVNRPELTAEKFLIAADPRHSWQVPKATAAGSGSLRLYRTGDIARWNAEGNMEFLGRADNQVKIGGARIELGEIEACLLKHADVRECVVDVVSGDGTPSKDDETSINRLAAYYVSGKPLTAAELRDHLAEELPTYMLPSHFIGLDRLPLTSNGKIDRKALPMPTSDNLATTREFVRPNTETEKALAVIWTELLKVENIGINDDFFELGGHSLLAIKAVSRIRDVFEVDLQTESLFESPTISALSILLTEALGSRGNVQRIRKRGDSGPAPLSFPQEQLWFVDQLTHGSPVYNIVDVIRFGGKYDAEAMKEALKELSRRHEVLRTAFSHTDGKPMQIVLPTVDLALPEVDLGPLGEREQEREWTRVVREQGRKPFELSQAPLIRGTMVHLSTQEHRLLMIIHHIIADEWSMDVIHREVNMLYKAFSHGRSSPLPELPIQYADFAIWQRDWLQGEELQRQFSYWKEQLAGAPYVLELPTDKLRPAEQSFRGAAEGFALPDELLPRLKALCIQEQTTLFMALEAAFAALLHRYAGQDDILVGTPISGRTHSETENLIGYFLNSVVLRSTFTGHMNFRSLLQQVRERARGAYAHADLPFQRLVAELAPERDQSRTPLFQVMFVVHNPDGVSEVSKVSGNRALETGTSKFDLTLVISETEHGLEGLIEYSTDLFESDTIRRMCGHFGTLLGSVSRDPDQVISRLPILTDAERRQLLVDWNRTTTDYPHGKCIHHLFEEQVERTPEAAAVAFEREQLNYRELNRRANQVAHTLKRYGVGSEVVVGICVERSIEMVVGLMGILKAGGAYLPLDPDLPMERLQGVIDDARVRVLLVGERFKAGFDNFAGAVLPLDPAGGSFAADSTENAACDADENSPAYVLYTSGSTGKPKGVIIPHRAICNHMYWICSEFGIRKEDRVLQKTPFGFDASVWEFFAPLIRGGLLVIARPGGHADGVYLTEVIREQGITILQLVPTQLQFLLQTSGFGECRMLRQVFCGGEILTPELQDDFFRVLGGELCNLYGPTECTIDATFWRCQKGKSGQTIPIGRPVANTQTYLLDQYQQPVPVGIPGELHIGGAQVATGYLNRPELTMEKFIPDPFSEMPGARLYKTGDLARYLPGGAIEYLGRNDFQVKIRGFRIELGEIEATLNRHPAVRQGIVVVTGDAITDKRLVAYLVPNEGQTPSVSELREHLREKLPGYMVPTAFVMLEKFPLTSSGKIDRRSLPAPTDIRPELELTYVAPRTEIERTITSIWQAVLHSEKIGIHDNFFDAGGNSLLATQVISRINKAFQADLSLRSFFENPAIAALSQIIEKFNNTGMPFEISPIVPISRAARRMKASN